ncbi:hypothetical protein D770_16445 [Flammeovirgaceae bacterium 311]|nr:hypothetical protein D770_16445 [Flammeovirgaceae bacterium 311]
MSDFLLTAFLPAEKRCSKICKLSCTKSKLQWLNVEFSLFMENAVNEYNTYCFNNTKLPLYFIFQYRNIFLL